MDKTILKLVGGLTLVLLGGTSFFGTLSAYTEVAQVFFMAGLLLLILAVPTDR